jgi:hypothetical protein
MSSKSQTHKTYDTKMTFCPKKYAEIHIQRPFLDNKIGIGGILGIKMRTIGTCFDASSIHGIFKINKKPKSQFFGGMSKFLTLIVFG